MVRMPKVDTVLFFAKIQDTPWGSCGDKDIIITLLYSDWNIIS